MSRFLVSFLILAALVAPAPAEAGLGPTVADLTRALSARMTVWTTPTGQRVFVGHCRGFHGGCETRITAFAALIAGAADRHRVDPYLLAAVALKESGLNPAAVGLVGERGIVQLHPRGVGRHVRYVQQEAYRTRCARRPDACQAEVVDAGAALLAASIARCGDVASGLGMYNAGRCSPRLPYVRRVADERERLVELAGKRQEIAALLLDES